MPDVCVVSCEHGGNRVPEPYDGIFAGAAGILASHRGGDIGAISLARRLSAFLGGPLFFTEVTRLLVDTNRSLHSRTLFSEFTRDLPVSLREEILSAYYHPYRKAVGTWVSEAIAGGGRVVHLSVHSFTPILRGKERRADVGFLYDPHRAGEVALCREWQRRLQRGGGLRVRCNYPYRGVSDSLVTALRREYGESGYLGIEIEINQRYPEGDGNDWQHLQKSLLASIPLPPLAH